MQMNSDEIKTYIQKGISQIPDYQIDPFFDSTFTKHIFVNGKSMYLKTFGHLKPYLDELIGLEVAKYFELPTIHQRLVCYEAIDQSIELGLVSEDLDPYGDRMKLKVRGRNQHVSLHGTVYYEESAMENTREWVERISKITFHNCFPLLKEQLLKLAAFSFTTKEVDRSSNLFYTIENKSAQLFPLFDFEDCFNDDSELYDALCVNAKRMKYLASAYPEFQYQIQKVFDLDMYQILKQVEETYFLQIPEETKDAYFEYVASRKEKLKKELAPRTAPFQKRPIR
ncbi:MAG: hypothetical protein KH135_04410 [Firmicutes bacterium]|nr:hypothetical protein [Bacillota bacterium]